MFYSTSSIDTTVTSLPWPSAGNLKHEQRYLQNQGLVMTDSQFRYQEGYKELLSLYLNIDMHHCNSFMRIIK